MSTLEKQKASQNLYGVEPYQESKGEEYMGEPMRKHFTKILSAWKQELMIGVDKTVDHMKKRRPTSPTQRTVPRKRKSSPLNCAPAIASAS